MSENMTPESPFNYHEYSGPPNDGGAGRGAERREPQTPVEMWVHDVKRHIDRGSASAFVHARVNYDVQKDHDGKEKVVRTTEGRQNHLHQNIDEKNADILRNAIGSVVKDKYSAQKGLIATRDDDKDDDTLYVTVINAQDISENNRYSVSHKRRLEHLTKVEGSERPRDVVEIRYKQQAVDNPAGGSPRSAEKTVYLVLPEEASKELQSLIRLGVDANELRDELADVFVSEDKRSIYEATLVNTSDASSPTIERTPPKADMKKIWLGVSEKSEEATYIGGSSQIYDSVQGNSPLERPVEPMPIEDENDLDDDESVVSNGNAALDALRAMNIEESEAGKSTTTDEESGVHENEWVQIPAGAFDELPKKENDQPEPVVPEVLPFVDEGSGRNGGGIGERPPLSTNESGDDETSIPLETLKESSLKSLEPLKVLEGLEDKDKEGQLRLVRELLDRLESNNLLIKDGQNIAIATALEQRISDMRKDVASEVKARIHLKESAAVVRTLTSPDEATQQRYRDLYSEAERNEGQRLLRNEDFAELLSQPEMNGIPVQIAFNVLQDKALNPITLSDGTSKKYMDDKSSRQEMEFHELLVRELIGQVRYTNESISEARERVEKAIDLADKISLATLERHVWMVDNYMGGGPISQAFYLHDFRKIGDPGPLATQPLIWGFGTSFFRQARYEDRGGKQFLFHNDDWNDVNKEERLRYAAFATHALQRIMPERATNHVKETIRRGIASVKNRRDRTDRQSYFDRYRFEQRLSDFRLPVEEVDFLKLSSSEYNKYLISYVPKILKVRELLLTETWDIKDMTDTDKISSWYGAFEKMDPGNKLQLRSDFLFGAIDQLIKGGVLQHTTGAELSQMYEAFTSRRVYFDPVEGNEKADQFISEEQLWRIFDRLNAWHRGGLNSVFAKLSGIYQTTRR